VTAAGGRAEKGEKSERVREYVTTHAIGLLHAHGPWPARLLPACLWSHHLDGAERIHKIEAHARARRPLATANLRLLLLLDDGSASICVSGADACLIIYRRNSLFFTNQTKGPFGTAPAPDSKQRSRGAVPNEYFF
jgi:hypothetical protein